MISHDELTQPLSESYIHLSEDLSETVSLDNARENTEELRLLCKNLDRENQFMSSKLNFSPTSNFNSDLSKHASSKPSSHSTPLIKTNPEHHFNSYLPDISENQTVLNEHSTNTIPQAEDQTTSPRHTVNNDFIDKLPSSVGQQIVDSLKQVVEQLIIDHTKPNNQKPDNFTTPIKSNSSSPKLQDSPLTTPPDSNDQHYYTKSFDQSYDNSYLNKKSKENNQRESNSFEKQQEVFQKSKSPFLGPEQQEKSPSPVNSANAFPMASTSSPMLPSSTSTKIASAPGTQENLQIEELQKKIDQMTTQINHLQTENINLQINMNNLHQQLLLKDEFQIEVSNTREAEELKQQNKELELKLQRLNQGYEELKNEYNWYRGNNKDKQEDQESKDDKTVDQSQTQATNITPDLSNDTRDTLVSKECVNCPNYIKTIKSLEEELQSKDTELNELRREIGNKDEIIDENKIPEKFVPKYHEYELKKLDDKTKVELVNVVKLIMLTLLISDVDNLGKNMTKYGTYLKLSIPFLDKIHEKLYDNNGPLKPSYYIRNKDGCDDDLQRLSKCLQGMLDTIG